MILIPKPNIRACRETQQPWSPFVMSKGGSWYSVREACLVSRNRFQPMFCSHVGLRLMVKKV